jgi:hypothetical protein
VGLDGTKIHANVSRHGDFGLGACFSPAWRGTGLCLSALYPCCNVLPPRMTVCAVRRAPGQYLLRSLPPVGRHLETLPDVHCELQRVAGGGRMSLGDRPGKLVANLILMGSFIPAFSPHECANYLGHSGYAAT